MNTLKTPKNPKAPEPEKKQAGPVLRAVTSVLDGSFLSRNASMNNVLFYAFLAVIAALYIANTYSAERIVRQTDHIGKELKELRSEYISLKSELMYRSNQSEVARLAAPLGLKVSKNQPFKLVESVNNTTSEEN